MSGDGVRLGVDVGGTFTDVVAVSPEGVRTTKVPSTPEDQSAGVLAAVAAGGIDPAQVTAFAHGMTVATNALLERRGARIALITTEGFRDLLEIGRQDRPSLYDLTADRPPALVPRERRFTVRERCGPEGVVVPLEAASLADAVEAVRAAEVEAVAVCLLFAFRFPDHEARVGAALRAALPGVHVSLSSEVLPEVREYERAATTVADAYLAPRLGAYLRRLASRASAAGLPRPLVMRSSGGVADLEEAAAHAAGCVLSGPAGGVVGAAHAAAASGFDDVLSLDMGGTSTDVAPIRAGRAATTTGSVVAGVPIRLPMVDVHTVSAGGGSVAWADPGGALRVGPRSAGADPGPAAYGRGGAEPTVTDANLALGRLADGAVLGGEVRLDRAAAEAALARVGEPLGLDVVETALGVVRVANAEMARALRVVSVERGLDPRGFALVAFGGAGGLHACALAAELAITTVLVPRAAGVLSALGLAISDLRADAATAFLVAVADADPREIDAAFGRLEAQAVAGLAGAVVARAADLRYRGQAFELTVDAGGADAGELAARFHAAHEERLGYRMAGEAVELVALRAIATVGTVVPSLAAERRGDGEAGAGPVAPARREACFDGIWREIDVHRGDGLAEGAPLPGPCIVELAGATCVIAPEWAGRVDRAGALVLERAA